MGKSTSYPSVLDEKFRIDAYIAEGGQATVCRVTHRLGCTFAMKCCTATDPTECQRFLDQGYVSNQIPSAHVLPALDDGRMPNGAPYLIFPYVVGQNAEERRVAAGGRLSTREVGAIGLQTASALCAAHDVGVLHRDLKPENLLLREDGHLFVIDWGGASYRTHLGKRTVAPALPPITLAYTSPEQARGEEPTVCSDVFGLGATMYALLAGRWPREESSLWGMLTNAAKAPLLPLQNVAPNVPDELRAIVDRATAFDPGDRYSSAAAMWADLVRAYRRRP
jgi:serine/threonine protein kinase